MVHITSTKVLLTTTLRPVVAQLSGSLAQGVRLLDQFDPRQTNVQNSRLDIKTCRNSQPF
jgi:hypothetical protein